MTHTDQSSAKGPPCTCGSRAVIDERKHAPDCKRRLWIEARDQAASDEEQHRG